MTAIVERVLALLALVAAGVTVASVVALLTRRVPPALRDAALPLAAAIAVVATGGSLYLSEVAGYLPCTLCWYQRIAMYPLVVILGVAAWRHDRQVWRTVLPLSLVGAGISTYHVLVENVPSLGGVCDATAPCTILWVQEFGFLTLPTMALIGFLAITALALVARTAPGPDVPTSPADTSDTSGSTDHPTEELAR